MVAITKSETRTCFLSVVQFPLLVEYRFFHAYKC
jgi:hypothetical protein